MCTGAYVTEVDYQALSSSCSCSFLLPTMHAISLLLCHLSFQLNPKLKPKDTHKSPTLDLPRAHILPEIGWEICEELFSFRMQRQRFNQTAVRFEPCLQITAPRSSVLSLSTPRTNVTEGVEVTPTDSYAISRTCPSCGIPTCTTI